MSPPTHDEGLLHSTIVALSAHVSPMQDGSAVTLEIADAGRGLAIRARSIEP